jgi:hypothetical protein
MSGGPLLTNVWFHTCMTYDYNGNQAAYWLNGINTSGNLPLTRGVPSQASTGRLVFGCSYSGCSQVGISNVQIYNTLLSAAEIQDIYLSGRDGKPVRNEAQGLTGFWPLNVAGDAKDYSAHANHGTISGGVTFVSESDPATDRISPIENNVNGFLTGAVAPKINYYVRKETEND